MPRLIPRLLDALAKSANKLTTAVPAPAQNRRQSAKFKSRVKTEPLIRPSLSADGRTHSILADDVNPIIHPSAFTRHKLPTPRTGRRASGTNVHAMNIEERAWSASPYLRMLGSKIRQDKLTDRYLPSDFLVRLAPMRLLASRGASKNSGAAILVPDGIQHPKFRLPHSGMGAYILCWRAALDEFIERGKYRRFGRVAPAIGDHIGHLLRMRILQELALLTESLYANRKNHTAASPILRRLTRSEFAIMKAEGVAPFPDAVAVLIVPPVNRNPTTLERVKPADASDEGPLPGDLTRPRREKLPLSVLHPISSAGDFHTLPTDSTHDLPSPSTAHVPLYNGATLFPHCRQRAALHQALCKVLMMEQRWRQRSPSQVHADNISPSRDKASHAFLLCSGTDTLARADAVPLAIALWRLRMWEGDAWGGNGSQWDADG